MSVGFGDQFYAAKFRDIINEMVDKRVNELSPAERIGKVYSYNTGTQQAEILFPGETIENLVKVRFAKNMTPTLSMKGLFADLGYNAPSDIVRVAGRPGGYWICDFVSGNPQGEEYFGNTYSSISEIKNSSWEDWQSATPRGDSGGTPVSKMFPRSWSSFWNDGSWFAEPDRDPNNVIGGGTSLKLTRAVGSTATSFRVNQEDAFLVEPGSIVEIAVWAKTNLVFFSSAQLVVTFLTNEFLQDPQFFASGVSGPTQSQGIGNTWKRYVYTFRVPSNHHMARIDFQANANLSDGEVVFWLDEATIRSQKMLVIPAGGYTSAAQAYVGTQWQGIGSPGTALDLRDGMTVSNLNLNFGGGLKVPWSGLYHVSLSVPWNSGTVTATTQGRRGIRVTKNNVATALMEDIRVWTNVSGRVTASEFIRLAKDDVLQHELYTDVANHHGGQAAGARLIAAYIPGAD